ncbi:MAG: HDOD domain-containing protein [Planctomycetia bacterium]|nr:HDOD domain-containing protein [Planctomycetia bacterium]
MPSATATFDLKQILAGAQLPALPQSAISLLQLSKDPTLGPAEFAKPIEADPGLTSQVLKFVNSSYFGFAREISNVKLAISLVGMRTIKNFALWSAVFSLMPNPRCGPFDLKMLWQDSLRRSLFARNMARLLGSQQTEEAFAAGLLQDMAVPLLAKRYAGDYAVLLEERHRSQYRLSQLERVRFGFTHAEVAGHMARHWNLPEEMAHLMEMHTEIKTLAPQAKLRAPEASVALSAMLPAVHDERWPECAVCDKFYRQMAPGGPALTDLLSKVDDDFNDLAPLLRITRPRLSLVESYRPTPA